MHLKMDIMDCNIAFSHAFRKHKTIIVALIILAYVELCHSCHRRVEYHHYYKKQPHKGHGHGYHGEGGSGYGHKGYGQGHGHHSGGGYGHSGGGHKVHGHNGHGGGGHTGYGHGHPGHAGHHEGGYGHGGGHKGYSEGHGHHGGGSGYGHGGSEMGYGHGGHGEYEGAHESHEGYLPGGDGGYNQGPGYNTYNYDEHNAHDHGERVYGQPYGRGKGHNNSGQKGHKYKFQMYESMHYDDKGGQQPAHGYAHSAPLYTQKGYGYSGPYPNTEYSTPVEASVNAPRDPNYDEIGIDGTPPNLDVADTADLIRNAIDTRENELVHQPLGNFNGSDHLSHLSDSSHGKSDYNSVDVFSTPPEVKISSSGSSRGETSLETNLNSAIGNFDLNLNYNSELPGPFRRNLFESSIGRSSEGRRKKISSKYRDSRRDYGSTSLPHDGESAHASHSQSGGPGPDYLENDTGDVGVGGSTI